MSDLVAEAITEAFGERCPDFEPECHCCKAWAEFDRITTLEAELQKAREALTPSGETKAAYIGEFTFRRTSTDEHGDERSETITVPWDTTKQIMAAIRDRALSQDKEAAACGHPVDDSP